MSYVIYHKETTIILRKHWYDKPYATMSAAKAGLTRWAKKKAAKGEQFNVADYDIADLVTFTKHIERRVIKKNLLGPGHFSIGVNEPACTDPSTETYHSM